ncbi:unnamed protein product [Rhizophagus irregularis]|uniref:Reverse transcriptase domain-containing protein n=1 Tax=Rhizophagus irregularis TaxID=588596 RepID=A0A915ZM90_9GLOM|nr:unnamed protein product [Rhizophagus irregularis]CAB5380180.1 unnamed protein product [Rhizophagus irregularis]
MYQNVISKWTKDQIDYYINERNNNLTNNQTKMINSLLQRKPRRIILDRLVYENSNNKTIFTNNSDIIEKQCIQHYQNIGQSDNNTIYDTIDDLPVDWRDIYKSENNSIDPSFWSCLEQTITTDDIIKVLPTLSKKKAPGPSKITNEDLIHLDRYALTILKDFFNLCIKLDLIPAKWKEALIFPIPKPTDWNCRLNNTRPITLLETPRKLMVTLISRKINDVLSKQDILQPNNRAGVLGQSTLEPLFVVQHLIELAKIQKQELWIVIQDLADDVTHEFSTSVIGYLDDTTWFGSSLEQLNQKLTIANSFYTMAKIKINEDKYKIMNNLQKKKLRNIDPRSPSTTSKEILIINNRPIECKITPSNKGERVLGVYINAHNRTQQTLSKAKMIVYSHYIALAKKKMTHDHVAYIIDKIILPKSNPS